MFSLVDELQDDIIDLKEQLEKMYSEEEVESILHKFHAKYGFTKAYRVADFLTKKK
jgi:hypothetical protein